MRQVLFKPGERGRFYSNQEKEVGYIQTRRRRQVLYKPGEGGRFYSNQEKEVGFIQTRRRRQVLFKPGEGVRFIQTRIRSQVYINQEKDVGFIPTREGGWKKGGGRLLKMYSLYNLCLIYKYVEKYIKTIEIFKDILKEKDNSIFINSDLNFIFRFLLQRGFSVAVQVTIHIKQHDFNSFNIFRSYNIKNLFYCSCCCYHGQSQNLDSFSF